MSTVTKMMELDYLEVIEQGLVEQQRRKEQWDKIYKDLNAKLDSTVIDPVRHELTKNAAWLQWRCANQAKAYLNAKKDAIVAMAKVGGLNPLGGDK